MDAGLLGLVVYALAVVAGTSLASLALAPLEWH
jgi:hypothetical protein